MYSIVAGGGKVGSNVTRTLIALGHEITLIEQRPDRFARLEEEFGPTVIRGDATEIAVLERAGIPDADAAVVATDGDNTNLVIGQVLQKRYGIGTVVVRVLDPKRAKLYADRGMSIVCPTQTAISELLATVESATPKASA